MADTQQEPSALADAYVAAIWYSAMNAYDHDGIGEHDDDAAIADLAQSINALRHPTSDAALREALVETRTVLSEIPAPYSLPLWSRMLAAIKMADAALKESGHD